MIPYYKRQVVVKMKNFYCSFEKGEAEPCPHLELFRTS